MAQRGHVGADPAPVAATPGVLDALANASKAERTNHFASARNAMCDARELNRIVVADGPLQCRSIAIVGEPKGAEDAALDRQIAAANFRKR